MSAKSHLQEIFQKQGKSLPIYQSVREGGYDHSPRFSATVILANGRKYFGKGSNKREAEKDAAEQALKDVQKRPPRSRSKKPVKRVTTKPKIRKSEGKICILIDLENKPKIPEELVGHIEPGMDVIAFASTEHPTLKSLRDKKLEFVQIVEVPCTRKNGADIGLTLFVGLLLNQNYESFIIVSGDSFGYCLADCIQNIDQMVKYKGKVPKAVCCKTLEGVLKSK